MTTNKKVLEVTPSVSWVGVLDYDIVTFDIVMETKYGTTYNSFYINAEKKTVIDSVKEKFFPDFVEKLSQLTPLEEIEYIVCNHTEPDHSGSIKRLLEMAPNATVVGSGQALNYLSEMIGVPFKSMKVKDGDVLDLGNKKLKIIGAPNLHWPDTIYSYLEEDKILFTCDSFGAHYCHEEMFDDRVGDYADAFLYYFNVILRPFSKFMLKAIEKIKPLEINTICPGHGPILRETWKSKIELSELGAKAYLELINPEVKKVLIAYVSAYGYTREMAGMIAKGIGLETNFETEIVDLENINLETLEEKVASSAGVIVGSPTINQNTLLPVYKLFSVVNPIRDKGKLGAAFGSYGWSGEAIELIETNLNALKLDVFNENASAKFYPHPGKAESFIEFGKKYASQLYNSLKEEQ